MSGHFDPAYPVSKLSGADYNPRIIAPETLDELAASILRVGFAKPIVVTEAGLIVAGHQRTRTARELGLETVPAWVLPRVSKADEIRFNQLHNGTDWDKVDVPVRIAAEVADLLPLQEFASVHPDAIHGDPKTRGQALRSEICKLTIKHGDWGGAVVTGTGRVISGHHYLLAFKTMRRKARVYRIPDETADAAADDFARQYGRFSYEHLERTPWLQTYAAPPRLRQTAEVTERGEGDRRKYRRDALSSLYEALVIPNLREGDRIFDLGCGKGDYAAALRRKGWQIIGYEPFTRRGMTDAIDTRRVHAQVDALCAELERGGRFPVVLADAVINSVVSQQAEADVLNTLAALALPGARVYFAGRCAEHEEIMQYRMRLDTGRKLMTRLYFQDENGLSAMYRKGGWFFQKFHQPEQREELARRHFGELHEHVSVHGTNFQISAAKTLPDDLEVQEAALRAEFDLPWPGGRSIGRADDVVAAWKAALAKEGV